MSDAPEVTITLSYDQALRLSYMARFPTRAKGGDAEVADLVDAAVKRAEDLYREVPDA